MTNKMSGAQISTPSEREVRVVRDFAASRERVFEAFTRPELVRRWMLGPDGWTMPVCEIDLRVGGRYRYVWRRESTGEEMGLGGVYREVILRERIVAVEQYDQPWYPGEGVETTEFEEHDGHARVVITLRYESKEARDIALQSGVDGMSAGYDRLEELLVSGPEES